MNCEAFQDVRAGFLLVLGLTMLAGICALASRSAVMRPVRWADRSPAVHLDL